MIRILLTQRKRIEEKKVLISTLQKIFEWSMAQKRNATTEMIIVKITYDEGNFFPDFMFHAS